MITVEELALLFSRAPRDAENKIPVNWAPPGYKAVPCSPGFSRQDCRELCALIQSCPESRNQCCRRHNRADNKEVYFVLDTETPALLQVLRKGA